MPHSRSFRCEDATWLQRHFVVQSTREKQKDNFSRNWVAQISINIKLATTVCCHRRCKVQNKMPNDCARKLTERWCHHYLSRMPHSRFSRCGNATWLQKHFVVPSTRATQKRTKILSHDSIKLTTVVRRLFEGFHSPSAAKMHTLSLAHKKLRIQTHALFKNAYTCTDQMFPQRLSQRVFNSHQKLCQKLLLNHCVKLLLLRWVEMRYTHAESKICVCFNNFKRNRTSLKGKHSYKSKQN